MYQPADSLERLANTLDGAVVGTAIGGILARLPGAGCGAVAGGIAGYAGVPQGNDPPDLRQIAVLKHAYERFRQCAEGCGTRCEDGADRPCRLERLFQDNW